MQKGMQEYTHRKIGWETEREGEAISEKGLIVFERRRRAM